MSKFYPKAILLILFCCLIPVAFSQKEQLLNFILYRYRSLDALSQAKIVNAITDMRNYILAHDPGFSNRKVQYGQLDYGDGPEELAHGTIALLNPLLYANFVYEKKAPITPILMTTKRNDSVPYYQSMFITAKNSGITSIYSDSIKTIYLVHGNSASGFLLPLYQLYYDSIIQRPDTHSLGQRFHFEFCGSHNKVIEKVQADPHSIGATCYSGGDEGVVTLLRFGCIPEDPIVISNDLLPYKQLIIDWFRLKLQKNSQFLKNDMGRMEITGITGFTLEHANSFEALYTLKKGMYKCWNNCPATAEEIEGQHWHSLAKVGISILLAVSLMAAFIFSYKSSKNPERMERYAYYGRFSFSVFIGSIIELLRLFLEGHPTIPSGTSFAVGALASFILELNKHRFAAFISYCLAKIHPVVKSVGDGFSNINKNNGHMW